MKILIQAPHRDSTSIRFLKSRNESQPLYIERDNLVLYIPHVAISVTHGPHLRSHELQSENLIPSFQVRRGSLLPAPFPAPLVDIFGFEAYGTNLKEIAQMKLSHSRVRSEGRMRLGGAWTWSKGVRLCHMRAAAFEAEHNRRAVFVDCFRVPPFVVSSALVPKCLDLRRRMMIALRRLRKYAQVRWNVVDALEVQGWI